MLQLTVDKFTFRIPDDLLFSDDGVWVDLYGARAKLGLSDFAQQVSGDIAFANVKAPGTELTTGDEFGTIETVKVNVGLPSPVTGRIVQANPLLQDAPESINRDPYGKGWMIMVELSDPAAVFSGLLDAPRYLDLVRTLAQQELRK